MYTWVDERFSDFFREFWRGMLGVVRDYLGDNWEVARGKVKGTLRKTIPGQIRKNNYAHMLIVVAFLVVNFFRFLVIAPSHQLQSGRK